MDLRTAVAEALDDAENVSEWPTDASGNPVLLTGFELRDPETDELLAVFSGSLRLHKLWENAVVQVQTESKVTPEGEVEVTVEDRTVHRPIAPTTYLTRKALVALLAQDAVPPAPQPATAAQPARPARRRR
jgi:hypothetical protein